MDIVLGLTGKDYVLCVTDMSSNRSINALKHDEEKIVMIDDRKMLACGGEQCSRNQFTEYISKNLALNQLQTDLELSNHGAANFIRNEVARALRAKGGAYQANSILAGVDDQGPAMYYIDYMGSLVQVDYTAQGYCGYFSLSILDRYWKKNMTLEEGKELLKLCIEQLSARFIIKLNKLQMVAIGPQGVISKEIIISP